MNYEQRDPYGIYKNKAVFTSGPSTVHGPGPQVMGANTLIGNNVYNSKAESIGDIKEIMLDMRSGHVSYAVLSFGGFLGMGEKLFAVPWAALKLDTENKRFTLDVDRAKLEAAPGFDKNHWPDMADSAWEQGIHSYYGTRYNGDNRPN
ncbi:PRC-barrel domain-containing protein [Aquimonas sp.]|jgi:sporulation protein YlmC with PRC-barrel domain|uniref:PRC-barrel domain-containing protein n=1 Tax=Aquimonas sp. TaxID=1872588 RepID=UPI0037BE7C4B